VVQHHGVFQSYYYAHHLGGDRHARNRFRDHRWGPLCEQFCADFDQNCFDPEFPIDPLSSFRTEIDEVFARVAWSPEVVAVATERIIP
jgi:predicted HD phosphohydrolase